MLRREYVYIPMTYQETWWTQRNICSFGEDEIFEVFFISPIDSSRGCFLFVLKLRGFSWVREDLVGQQRDRLFLFLFFVFSFSSEHLKGRFRGCLSKRPTLFSQMLFFSPREDELILVEGSLQIRPQRALGSSFVKRSDVLYYWLIS